MTKCLNHEELGLTAARNADPVRLLLPTKNPPSGEQDSTVDGVTLLLIHQDLGLLRTKGTGCMESLESLTDITA